MENILKTNIRSLPSEQQRRAVAKHVSSILHPIIEDSVACIEMELGIDAEYPEHARKDMYKVLFAIQTALMLEELERAKAKGVETG